MTRSVVNGLHPAVKSVWGVLDIRGVGRKGGLSNDFELQPATSVPSISEAEANLFRVRIAVVKIDIV